MIVLIVSWLANALTLYILARLFPQHIIINNLIPADGGLITMQGFITVMIGALVIGALNAVLKPLLKLLTLPLTCLTLGLFSFVVTGIVFYLAALFTPGFHVSGILWAIIGGVLFGIINSIISGLLGVKQNREERE